MKANQLIATLFSAVLAVALLAGCESKGKNTSGDSHDNDMQRTENTSRGADSGHYKDK